MFTFWMERAKYILLALFKHTMQKTTRLISTMNIVDTKSTFTLCYTQESQKVFQGNRKPYFHRRLHVLPRL